jgi:hypothetical protein
VALDHIQAGKVLSHATPELLRIWRLARSTARPQVFPGLLDGVMGDFLARAGKLLRSGAPPEDVWPGVAGTIRWSPAGGGEELTTEWAVAMEVITAAIDSADFDPSIGEWLARAIATAEVSTARIGVEPTARPPPRIVLVRVYSSLARPQRAG